MAKTKLEPLSCPFCGGPPFVGPYRPDEDGDGWAFVQCLSGRCHVKPRVETHSAARGSARGYKQVAIYLWNLRPASLNRQS